MQGQAAEAAAWRPCAAEPKRSVFRFRRFGVKPRRPSPVRTAGPRKSWRRRGNRPRRRLIGSAMAPPYGHLGAAAGIDLTRRSSKEFRIDRRYSPIATRLPFVGRFGYRPKKPSQKAFENSFHRSSLSGIPNSSMPRARKFQCELNTRRAALSVYLFRRQKPPETMARLLSATPSNS